MLMMMMKNGMGWDAGRLGWCIAFGERTQTAVSNDYDGKVISKVPTLLLVDLPILVLGNTVSLTLKYLPKLLKLIKIHVSSWKQH